MKKQIYFAMSFFIFFGAIAQSENKSTLLFQSHAPLKVKLSYSNKEMKKKTNDSTLINTTLSYQQDNVWKTVEVSLRARGNFRRSKCYFPPIKMKIKKSNGKETLFEGNKSLKLVLPCLLEKEKNDNILQEYLAYKFYENISPYHFKTRRVDVTFDEIKGKKTISHQLTGFLIEDDDNVADRFEGKAFERYTHPLAMDAITSIKVSMHQYLIGNTDYSVAYQHNGKLLFVDKKILPLPYDFDMSGFVNPSYSVVNSTLGIDNVRDRKYRGFKRDEDLVQEVRQQYIAKKDSFFKMLEDFESQFDIESQYSDSMKFLTSFFEVLEDDKAFKKKIIDGMRTK